MTPFVPHPSWYELYENLSDQLYLRAFMVMQTPKSQMLESQRRFHPKEEDRIDLPWWSISRVKRTCFWTQDSNNHSTR